MIIRPNGAYDFDSALTVLASHGIPGAEITDLRRRTHTRVLIVAGRPLAVTLHFMPGEVRLDVHDPGPDTDIERIAALVRRWLDLDTDLTTVRATLGIDPALAPLLARRSGLRITGCADSFEGTVMTVLGQHVSIAAARVFGGRLVDAAGGVGALGLRRFPTADTLAAMPPDTLKRVTGITTARAQTVKAIATSVADGLSLDPDGDHTTIRRDLGRLFGLGRWTVEYVALRCLADRDAYPVGDRVLQRALDSTDAVSISAVGESWHPFRAYAASHLWASQLRLPMSQA
jgi:3-methyladenine DNA glycosylase/8-oxoguanine DNA glycosylase